MPNGKTLRPGQKSLRLSARELAVIAKLAAEDETSESDAIRKLIREAGRKRKLL